MPVSATPSVIPSRRQLTAIVSENKPLCREHFRLTLRLADYPKTQPGQFVQLACRDLERDESAIAFDRPADHPPNETFVRTAYLRRPFSLAGRRDTRQGVELDVIHRVVGLGTDWLSRLNVGDEVSVLGPLGNRFVLPEPGQTALLVAGGVGIPPMLYLAQA